MTTTPEMDATIACCAVLAESVTRLQAAVAKGDGGAGDSAGFVTGSGAPSYEPIRLDVVDLLTEIERGATGWYGSFPLRVNGLDRTPAGLVEQIGASVRAAPVSWAEPLLPALNADLARWQARSDRLLSDSMGPIRLVLLNDRALTGPARPEANRAPLCRVCAAENHRGTPCPVCGIGHLWIHRDGDGRPVSIRCWNPRQDDDEPAARACGRDFLKPDWPVLYRCIHHDPHVWVQVRRLVKCCDELLYQGEIGDDRRALQDRRAAARPASEGDAS